MLNLIQYFDRFVITIIVNVVGDFVATVFGVDTVNW